MERAVTSSLRNNGWDLLTSKCVVCTYQHALCEDPYNVDSLTVVYFNLIVFKCIGNVFKSCLDSICMCGIDVGVMNIM